MLHSYNGAIPKEPLPERWVDLIKSLSEKEREQRQTETRRDNDQLPRPRSN
jgi:hypothetical protein